MKQKSDAKKLSAPRFVYFYSGKLFYILQAEMFTLWTLLEASLLCLNAVCVLHEERFLAKCKSSQLSTSLIKVPTHNIKLIFLVGWGSSPVQQQGFEPPTVKSQILNLVRSIRTVVKSKMFIHRVSGIKLTKSFIFQFL